VRFLSPARPGRSFVRTLAGMSQGAWKLELSVTGECKPGCMYYGMPGAPQHRHWLQQPPPPVPARPMGPVMRVLSRLWGEG
jgi:hypothetical protein